MRKPGAGTHYKFGFGKVIANGRHDFFKCLKDTRTGGAVASERFSKNNAWRV